MAACSEGRQFVPNDLGLKTDSLLVLSSCGSVLVWCEDCCCCQLGYCPARHPPGQRGNRPTRVLVPTMTRTFVSSKCGTDDLPCCPSTSTATAPRQRRRRRLSQSTPPHPPPQPLCCCVDWWWAGDGDPPWWEENFSWHLI